MSDYTAEPAEATAYDIDRLTNLQGCGRFYQAVVECLNSSDKDYRLCQTEIRAFKNCYKHSEYVKKVDASSSNAAVAAVSQQ